ncbi:nuclear transport factor 2 family protein [Endozoicomonas elysicola]|uniref:SnoaL-like domain-containing protein n=1 Tax=Endozoicomonas elysicola TaxID=305900 RepID=A0A081K9V7_9GAMM|nr:nuclear transport factor 2 family protein [Endozoicomonas elysicola]KEI70933.1 hypothetical protein GV64_09465 [Endozoicomonas elysicola]
MTTTRQHLIDLTFNFMEAFNTNNLDEVMTFFTEDAIYDEFNNKRNKGKEAIRRTLEPQFSGRFGVMQFLDEDLFIDAESGKVMVSWLCKLEVKDQPVSWRGLDLLHFNGDKVVQKLTYAKSKVPLFHDC